MIWKKIFDDYEVSEVGTIRNIKTKHIIKQFIGRDGYVRTQIAGKTRLVHRIVAMAFLPIVDGKDFVNHIDGKKENNAVENLEWCTRSENQRHAYAYNLMSADGEKNSNAKLSTEDVNYIRTHYIKGDKTFGAKALAKKYGVTHQAICAVVYFQNWR